MRKLTYEELIKLRKNENEIKLIKRNPIKLILYNIRSLYNVGSIFRTADSALVDEIILTGFTPYPPRKEIDKTALGATKTVPWRYFKDIKEILNELKNKYWKIYALELTDNAIKFNQIPTNSFPIAIIAGNEISGIDNSILELCDNSIYIPMYGVKHSLNVSVAVGITVYEILNILERNNL